MFGFGSRKINVGKYFKYNPRDIAIAFGAVAESRYGLDSLRGVWLKFFRAPITFDMIKVQQGEERGILGSVCIFHKKLRGTFTVEERTSLIVYEVLERYQKEADAFLEAVGAYLKEKSIYRGKPISLNGEFINLSAIDPGEFVYAPSTLEDLKANLWTLLEKGDRCKEVGIAIRKRRVLLTGQFGAGKTSTALLTAKKAVENGWTFISVPPSSRKGDDSIGAALEVARQYQPAVVFIKDIDHEQRSGNLYAFKKILDDIDGVLSKDAEVIVLMTANKSDMIEGAMQRPGRIDKIIDIGTLTTHEIQRIIRGSIRSQYLDEHIEWDPIAERCKNYPPAFIKEIAMNALLSMVSKNETKIGTAILMEAADALREQYKACARSMGFTLEK